MSKYRKLTEYLASTDQEQLTFNFGDLEELLGFALPDSARQYQAWWSNQMRSQSLAWQLAGWKTTALDLGREEVTFKYTGGEPDVQRATEIKPLTIAEAKIGLAVTFGIDPSQIDITVRG